MSRHIWSSSRMADHDIQLTGVPLYDRAGRNDTVQRDVYKFVQEVLGPDMPIDYVEAKRPPTRDEYLAAFVKLRDTRQHKVAIERLSNKTFRHTTLAVQPARRPRGQVQQERLHVDRTGRREAPGRKSSGTATPPQPQNTPSPAKSPARIRSRSPIRRRIPSKSGPRRRSEKERSRRHHETSESDSSSSLSTDQHQQTSSSGSSTSFDPVPEEIAMRPPPPRPLDTVTKINGHETTTITRATRSCFMEHVITPAKSQQHRQALEGRIAEFARSIGYVPEAPAIVTEAESQNYAAVQEELASIDLEAFTDFN